jgi:hypothetical protein
MERGTSTIPAFCAANLRGSQHYKHGKGITIITEMLKGDVKNADLAESAQLTQRDWAEPWIYETHQPSTWNR